jgi:hypothetical protein
LAGSDVPIRHHHLLLLQLTQANFHKNLPCRFVAAGANTLFINKWVIKTKITAAGLNLHARIEWDHFYLISGNPRLTLSTGYSRGAPNAAIAARAAGAVYAIRAIGSVIPRGSARPTTLAIGTILTRDTRLTSGGFLARRAGSTISAITTHNAIKTLSVFTNCARGRGTRNPLSRRGTCKRHRGCGKGHSQCRKRDRTHERMRAAYGLRQLGTRIGVDRNFHRRPSRGFD